MSHWLFAFLFTQLVEIPVYVAAQRRDGPVGRSTAAHVAIAFGASAWTHPVVWFVLPGVWALLFEPVVFVHGVTAITAAFALRAAAYLAFVEGFAVAGEALYLRAFGAHRALLWSLVANGASAIVGIASTWLTGWP